MKFGEPTNDWLIGGSGNDQLAGGDGGCTYMFATDDGDDTLADSSGVNKIRFDDTVLAADISVARIGDDLRLQWSGGSVVVQGMANSGGAERVVFADGSQLTRADLVALAVSIAPGSELLMGTVNDDLLQSSSSHTGVNAFGLEGRDTIYGSMVADVLDGGDGRGQKYRSIERQPSSLQQDRIAESCMNAFGATKRDLYELHVNY